MLFLFLTLATIMVIVLARWVISQNKKFKEEEDARRKEIDAFWHREQQAIDELTRNFYRTDRPFKAPYKAGKINTPSPSAQSHEPARGASSDWVTPASYGSDYSTGGSDYSGGGGDFGGGGASSDW